jgi:hypothetical protein
MKYLLYLKSIQLKLILFLIEVDDAKRYKELINKGIVIRNRTTQPLCENTLRLTIGIVEENKKLMEALLTIGQRINKSDLKCVRDSG